jgi:hypothetical protein
MGYTPTKPRLDIMALVAPKAKIRKRGMTKADLFRLRHAVGPNLKAGVTEQGDFILYSTDTATWRKLTGILPFLTDFREQRVDPVRNRVELMEIVDQDDPLFA